MLPIVLISSLVLLGLVIAVAGAFTVSYLDGLFAQIDIPLQGEDFY